MLVYVGAIVVLFIFVIQLTSTTINATSITNSNLVSNYLTMVIMLLLAYLVVKNTPTISTELLIYISNNNMMDNIMVDHGNLLSNTPVVSYGINVNSIKLLAQELFTEYAYVLIITIHGIVLSIIGAIPLAISRK